MISTLKERLKEKERRKFFVVFLGGKMIGVGIALLAVKYLITLLPSPAGAQGTEDLPQTDIINATNTAWVLVTAFLVFFMQAGFMMLEAGFARTREVVNILLECVDMALCAILFFAWASFMFGTGNGDRA
jgi:Amt family ammonium transporter